jgi:hypothetical protein
VPFFAPLKPLEPAEAQETTSPLISAMVTMVLLKVDWIKATPLGTLRFCFFAPVFFVGRAMSLD